MAFQVAALLTLSLAAVSRAAPAVDDAFYVDPMYQPYLTSLPMYPAVYLPAHPYLRTPYSNAPAYYPSPALNRFNANARLFGLSALLNLIDLKPLLPMMFPSGAVPTTYPTSLIPVGDTVSGTKSGVPLAAPQPSPPEMASPDASQVAEPVAVEAEPVAVEAEPVAVEAEPAHL